jgi:polysaccharide biosynthesis transport protein
MPTDYQPQLPQPQSPAPTPEAVLEPRETARANREYSVVAEPFRPGVWTVPATAPALPVGSAEARSATPLSHYLWILRRQRWKILAFVLICMILTGAVTQRLTPVFEATATVDIDRQTPQGIVGQESARSMTNDADQFLATQLRLVQSDSVLRPVALKYQLLQKEGQPPRSAEAPVTLKNLKVVRPPNTYLLLVSYRSPDPRLAADAANAIAQSYLDHTYNIRLSSSASLSRFMERQLEELKTKMEGSSLALSRFERELNVINPEEKTSILSARLLQLNTEHTTAQTDRLRKESAFRSSQGGTLEAAQVSTQGEALKKVMERVYEVRERFAEVKAHFGAGHPEYRRVSAQLAELEKQLDHARANIASRVGIEYREATEREQMLERAVGQTKREFDRLNAHSFEYQSLKREAEADKKLYEELVRKIKEAGINAGFQNSMVRVADPARPPAKPVFPSLGMNLALAFVLSSLTAVGLAVVGDALDDTIRDPEQVPQSLATEVVGSLPVVRNWRGRLGLASRSEEEGGLIALAGHTKPEQDLTGFGESIRSLRNSILLTDLDRRYRSLLVTSATPGEGKSTTAAHLAIAHAEQGYRTLLIDGDLRRPSVHRRFGLPLGNGLSNALLGELPWKESLVRLDKIPNLEILPAGPPSRRAGDLVGRGLDELMQEASMDYDLVVLDAPPLLGFSEPLQMASLVDGVLVVARAGKTSRKSVQAVLTTLQRLRAHVIGLVLNGVHKEISDSYYYYGHYRRYYSGK